MSIEEKPIIISTPKGSYIDRLMFENEYLFQKFKPINSIKTMKHL